MQVEEERGELLMVGASEGKEKSSFNGGNGGGNELENSPSSFKISLSSFPPDQLCPSSSQLLPC